MDIHIHGNPGKNSPRAGCDCQQHTGALCAIRHSRCSHHMPSYEPCTQLSSTVQFRLYGDEVLTGYQSQESVSTARQDYDSLTTIANLLPLLLGILPRRRIAADGEPRDE